MLPLELAALFLLSCVWLVFFGWPRVARWRWRRFAHAFELQAEREELAERDRRTFAKLEAGVDNKVARAFESRRKISPPHKRAARRRAPRKRQR